MYWLAQNRPWVLVLLSGLILAAAFPPSPLGPLAFLGFVPLFVLLENLPRRVQEDTLFLPLKKVSVVLWRILTLQFIWRRSIKLFHYERREISGNAQAFRYTYFAFLIWNTLCCYWLCLTVLNANDFQDAIERMMAGLLAVTLNPILMSIPWQFYMRIRRVFSPVASAASLMAFWIVFEWLHLHWELTWSWLTLGHALTYSPALLQYVEFTGVLGASLYILTASVLIYALVYHLHKGGKKHFQLAGLATAWMLLPLLLNIFILNPNREVFQSTGNMKVRIVQPSIDPEAKFHEFTLQEQMQHFYSLITRPGLDSIDLVLMPETAFPLAMDPQDMQRAALLRPFWQLTDSSKLSILTGIIESRIFQEPGPIPISASVYNPRLGLWRETYNAAVMMKGHRDATFYEKSKLVPLVERMPFLETFHWLKNMGIDMGTGFGGYGLPDSLVVLRTQGGVKVGVMICYESEFGDFVRLQTLKGAQVLTVITNDGWWAQSSGYIQHAHLSVLRAIENRRDIARSANTGRSCFVNSRGEMRQATDWWVACAVDGEVELYEGLTFYVRWGDWLGWLGLVVMGVVLGVGVLKNKVR